jgi:Fe-S cluster assembly ATP-binding protein
MHILQIENLHVSVEGKEILKGMDLTVRQGEIHAIMGRNGSGKSTLSLSIMGHPRYKVEKGKICFDGNDISKMPADKRAKLGLFLSFQNPLEVDGVSLGNFLRSSAISQGSSMGILDFQSLLFSKMDALGMDHSFIKRSLNCGFSGGEKKKSEILQLSVLGPKIAIIDEADSGLDIDAQKIVASCIRSAAEKGAGILFITHHKKLIDLLKPDFLHIMAGGKIVKSGGREIADHLEESGYAWTEGSG